MKKDYLIKKDLSDYKLEAQKIYQSNFGGNQVEAENIFNNIIDLKESYGGFVNNELVNMVCVGIKQIINNEQTYTIANVCAVATKQEFQKQGYATMLLENSFQELVDKYDSVILQAENWDFYDKHFDLIDNTIKYEYHFIPGEYPTPMVMTWNEPNDAIINSIEKSCENNLIGVDNPILYIRSIINIYQSYGYQFLANPFAYVWFDQEKNIIDLNYNDVGQLSWLLNMIQPKSSIWLFEQALPKELMSLKPTGKKAIITKTYAKSKKHFKNIKLIDFFV